jgi:hypothetical protein
MTRLFPAVVIALAVAGCGQRTASSQPAAQSQVSPSIAGAAVVDPKAVPVAFQGVWAATEDDCAKPSESRLAVAADSLNFYESRGPVLSVEGVGSDEILVAVAVRGEGEAGRRTFRYRLINGGAGLFDVRSGLTRVRCPA